MRSVHVTSVVAMAIGLLIPGTTATVDLGNDALGNNFMWLDGDSSCTARKFVGCGNPVTLANGFTYILQGCDGQRFLLNGDGSFNHACSVLSKPFPTDCGIELTQRC